MSQRNSTARARLATVEALASTADAESFDPVEELERKVRKLTKINNALIDRVERSTDQQGNSYSLFQTAILLEKQVHDRTEQLHQALRNLEDSNKNLSHAKEEAETARLRLSEAIESLSEGFVLFDPEDRIVLFNSKYRALFPTMADLIKPGVAFADFLRAAIERRIVAVKPQDGQNWIERRLQRHRRPGAPIVEGMSDGRWLQVSERPTRSGGTVGIYTDVTGIKEVEARLREKALEEKSIQLTATLDNLVQGVSVFDHDHRLAYWNQRFLSLLGLPSELVREGMRFEEILGCDAIKRAFPEADLKTGLVKWARSHGRGYPFHAEYQRSDGVVVEVQRNPMPGGGFVSTYTDITERRQAERFLKEAKGNLERRVAERTAELTELNEELRIAKAVADKANHSKTKFLAAASHDLLQPLNAARLFVSALSDSEVSVEAARLIDRVDTALESVDELLKALFDISKFDTGIILPDWSDFSVEDIFKALASEYALLAEQKGLVLHVVPCRVVIRSDMLLLRRILQNFLSNAIRYTKSGRVLLGCRRKACGLSIEVWDTGPGIPCEHRESIFDEFQRIVTPEDKGDRGFGLGLAIAQRSARVMGVPLHLRSAIGKGSVFSVEVPYGHRADRLNADVVTHPGRNYGLGNATVVFIENDDENLEAMTALLRSWSCRVLAIHDVDEATTVIDRNEIQPDLIIADYHLDNGIIGLDAIAELRARFNIPIPGIIVTADHTTQAQEAAQRAGYDLLQKPIKPAALRSLMAHLLA
jgi:PAS domain S-box-containing protein